MVVDDLVSFLRVEGPVDVFVLSFKLGDIVSLRSVETRWKEIVDRVDKHVPIMVVGLRSDEFGMSSSAVRGVVATGCKCIL